MTLFQNRYRIESNRLPGRDYALPGYYFVTSNVNDQIQLFGKVTNGVMLKSEYGEIVEKCWEELPNHYHNMICDTFMVMPDHIHAIIRLTYEVETGLRPVFFYPHPQSFPHLWWKEVV